MKIVLSSESVYLSSFWSGMEIGILMSHPGNGKHFHHLKHQVAYCYTPFSSGIILPISIPDPKIES